MELMYETTYNVKDVVSRAITRDDAKHLLADNTLVRYDGKPMDIEYLMSYFEIKKSKSSGTTWIMDVRTNITTKVML